LILSEIDMLINGRQIKFSNRTVGLRIKFMNDQTQYQLKFSDQDWIK